MIDDAPRIQLLLVLGEAAHQILQPDPHKTVPDLPDPRRLIQSETIIPQP